MMCNPRSFKRFFAYMSILTVFVFTGLSWGQGNSEAALQWAKDVQDLYTDVLMDKPGVVGTAVGTGQGAAPVVLVLTDRGEVQGLPGQLEGVPVRPWFTGKIYAVPKPDNPGNGNGNGGGNGGGEDPPSLSPTDGWPSPVPIGVSIGHPDITAGTLGCRLTGSFILSNNHVFANENKANIGDAVIQPGSYDGGMDPDDVIGTLYKFEEIDFSGGDNVIDAAIVSIGASRDVDISTPPDGYGAPKTTPIEAELNMSVKKYGRTTGLTKGKVYAINATVNVGYSSGVARFVDQIIITPGSFSAGGDSGSLVVADGKGKNKADDRKPVGLLFAGSSLVTIANPINDVLGILGVSIDGE